MRFARESWILAAVCIADLITTLWFVDHQGAREANPVMEFFLMQGVFAFILAKLLLFVGPIGVLEWARKRRPAFVRSMLRVAIVGYLGSYALVVWRINGPAQTDETEMQEMLSIQQDCARAVPLDKLREEMDRINHRLSQLKLTDSR